MSPAAESTLECFAVRRGEIRNRADANYSAASRLVDELLLQPNFPLVRLGELAEKLQYGISLPASKQQEGYPILRMNNLRDEGWDLSDLKYIELTEKEAEGYLINKGDILFNRTNSKELVGKCDVFREDGAWVFASYLIRVTVDQSKALPEFVSAFLNTRAGRAQINRLSRAIVGMSNINAEEIRSLLIPLPLLSVQAEMVAQLQAARKSREQKTDQVDDLMSSLDRYLLDRLGITPASEDIRLAYSVTLSSLKGRRLDPPAYRPYFVGLPPATPTLPLGQIASINSNVIPKPSSEDDLVPYIGLPECDLTHVQRVVTRPYREVKGRNIITLGDILFARIEPSVYNKKYVLADDLQGYDHVYTSTEFYVVRTTGEQILQEYLYAMFFCSFVYNQVVGKTTGSSGRRRIDLELFAGLQIPVPDLPLQQEIASDVARRRSAATQLRSEAVQEWESAKLRFEHLLLNSKV